jgi:hypothetical protein
LEGLNKRLEFEEPSLYTPKTFEDLYMRMIIERKMTLQEVLMIPEKDDSVYSDGI